MNNLKRVFSLALASVMLIGMMAVGASAADVSDFSDGESVTHTEAVSTMATLGVIEGYPDGTYLPEKVVTRAEMAAIITRILNGGKTPTLGTSTSPLFTDVSGWARPYVEYCANLHIVDGMGDGTFHPDDTVTAAQAAKMLLGAAGYKSNIYGFTGSDWELNVNRIANQQGLYGTLDITDTSEGLKRDNAAQMAYNSLDIKTIKEQYTEAIGSGNNTVTYIAENTSVLEKYFGVKTFIGTFDGNSDTDSVTAEDGEIIVTGVLSTDAAGTATRTAHFPSDFDISNIGEQVKVIYKEAVNGTANEPDKKDTILGVFNTGASTVYTGTKADLTANTTANKITFNGKTLTTAATIEVMTNYETTASVASATFKTNNTKQLADTIKFVANSDGKIDKAYIVEQKMSRVTAVTATKVTLANVGSITIADHKVYEGIAKDDVVVYTKIYGSDYAVTKAETIEGKVTGFKDDGTNLVNVVLDGTTYKTNGTLSAGFDAYTTDPVTTPTIGTEVRAYLVGGLINAMQVTKEAAVNYALVLEKNSGTVGSNLNPATATFLLSDGTKVTRTIDGNSTKDGATGTALTTGDLALGVLVQYSTLTDEKIKIVDLALGADGTTHDGKALALTKYTAGGNGVLNFWDEDTKLVAYKQGNRAAAQMVAASDAVLFTARDTDTGDGTIDLKDSFNAYKLRSLGTIANDIDSTGTNDPVKVAYFLNETGDQVAAVYVDLGTAGKPSSEATTTRYGIVNSYVGTRENADEVTLQQYTISVGADETMTVGVAAANEAAAGLKAGYIVSFDERTDGEYAPADFTVLMNGTDDTPSTAGWSLAALRGYDETTKLLSYYNATGRATVNDPFGPKVDNDTNAKSITVDKDVKVYYVNATKNTYGDEVGLDTAFDPNTGYANAMFHTNAKNVVDVVVIETSGTNLAQDNAALTTAAKKAKTANFGATATWTMTGLDTAALTTTNTGISVKVETVAATTVDKGATYTFTITVTTTNTTNVDDADKDIKIALNKLDGITLSSSTGVANCAASVVTTAGSEALLIDITAATTATTGVFVVTGTPSGNISAAVSQVDHA